MEPKPMSPIPTTKTPTPPSTGDAARTARHAASDVARVTDAATEAAKGVADEARLASKRAIGQARASAESTYEEVVEFGQHLPERISSYARALDRHVHEHPRTHLAIVAGTSALLGAVAGRRLVRLGLLAASAYAVTRLYPEIERAVRARAVDR